MAEKTGLPVAGYQPQSDHRVALVNGNKAAEERVLRILDELAVSHDVDQRWLAIGRTQIEQGFMAVNRSIFQPARAALFDDAGESAWLIERADSPASAPLYYGPFLGSEPWTENHMEALRFARQEDAQRFAEACLVGNARVAEHRWD